MILKRIFVKTVIPFAIAAVTSVSAFAMDFSKNDDAVYLRKAKMALIGTYFGDMGAMIKGKKPFDANQFKTDADRLAAISLWAGTGFESSKYMDSSSKSKPEIWENKAEFDKLMADLGEHAEKLKVAAASGNVKDSLPAFQAMADNCGACHKKFKNK